MEKQNILMKTKNEKEIENPRLPNTDEVISEWFSQKHPDRLKHNCMWKDHNQYREYHKSI